MNSPIKQFCQSLTIPCGTAEVHLNNVYSKADINHANQLRLFCREKGINRYLPPKFLPSGSQVISV